MIDLIEKVEAMVDIAETAIKMWIITEFVNRDTTIEVEMEVSIIKRNTTMEIEFS